jgi:hypothetical protein
MAGSFAEARAQILSLQPAVLRAKAGEVRSFGSASVSAGSTLRASADRLGAQRGAPYRAYQERLAPTAGWLTGLSPLSNDTAATLVNAAQAAERAQMVLAQQEEALARFGVNPSTTPAAFAAAEAQALAALNTAIADVTQAYGVITPVTPTAAPVVASTAGAAGTGGGSTATGLNGVGGAVGASAGGVAAAAARAGGTSGAASGAGTAGTGTAGTGTAGDAGGAGPTSGPFAGFVQDPTTGNLIDPATGRQADAGGRFLDPITGQPFGPASPFVSRLEGLDGGVSPVGGLLGGTAGPGVSVGALAPGLAGAPAGVGAGGVGLVAGGALPFLAGGGAGAGFAASRGRAGSGSIAALYGGVVPPSLSGRNPAAAQLRQQAAENLSTMAGTARRYSAISAGQAPGAYLPPMAGAGAGAAGGGGAGRPRGRSLPRTGEPASVWGAAPGAGGRPDRRRPPSRSTADVEDDEVWNGGTTVPSLLEGR